MDDLNLLTQAPDDPDEKSKSNAVCTVDVVEPSVVINTTNQTHTPPKNSPITDETSLNIPHYPTNDPSSLVITAHDVESVANPEQILHESSIDPQESSIDQMN